MKNKLLITIFFILSAVMTVGCSEMFSRFGRFYNNDHEVANTKFEEVLAAIQHKDKKIKIVVR